MLPYPTPTLVRETNLMMGGTGGGESSVFVEKPRHLSLDFPSQGQGSLAQHSSVSTCVLGNNKRHSKGKWLGSGYLQVGQLDHMRQGREWTPTIAAHKLSCYNLPVAALGLEAPTQFRTISSQAMFAVEKMTQDKSPPANGANCPRWWGPFPICLHSKRGIHTQWILGCHVIWSDASY